MTKKGVSKAEKLLVDRIYDQVIENLVQRPYRSPNSNVFLELSPRVNNEG